MFLLKNIFNLTAVCHICLWLSACDIGQNSKGFPLAGRELLETGYIVEATLTSPLADNDNNIYWIDDQHVFFKESRELNPFFSGEHEKMHIWNVVSGDVYNIGEADHKVCIRDKEVRYYRLADPKVGKQTHQFSRALEFVDGRYQLGEEKFRGGDDVIVDLNCNYTPRPSTPGYVPNSHVLAEFGLRLQPINDEVDEYKNNRRLGIYREEELLKILPLRERQIYYPVYSQFNHRYLIKTGFQPDPKARGRGGWPIELREISYLLDSELQLTPIELPDSWLNANRTPFLLSPVGIVANGYIKSPEKADDLISGLFLLSNNHVDPVITATVFHGAMNSSNCRIVSIVAPVLSRNYRESMSSRTLKVINLCHKEN